MNPRADRSTHTQGPEALTASRQRITPIGRRAFTIRARRVGGNEIAIAATSVRSYLLLLINVLQRAYSIPSVRGCGTSAIIPFLTAPSFSSSPGVDEIAKKRRHFRKDFLLSQQPWHEMLIIGFIFFTHHQQERTVWHTIIYDECAARRAF